MAIDCNTATAIKTRAHIGGPLHLQQQSSEEVTARSCCITILMTAAEDGN